jgi:outer membrane protease
MRSITAFAVLVFICAGPVLSQGGGSYAFSAGPDFGMFYGHTEEIVYPPDSNYNYKFLSLLLWDMKPVFYYGIKLDFSQTEPIKKWGFFTDLSFKLGIPGISGNMEDFDWQSIENAALTNYSKHDNTTKELFLLDFSAGLSFPLVHGLLVKALVDVSYKRLSFYGTGGYLKYARVKGTDTYYPIDNNPLIITIPSKEKVINYTQEWLVVAPGVSLRYYFFRQLFAELSFQISPLILCADLDEHLLSGKKIQYQDYPQGGLYLEPGLRVSYSAGKWLEFSLEWSWQYITGSKGEAYNRLLGNGYYMPVGSAGTGLSLLDTGLFLKIRF